MRAPDSDQFYTESRLPFFECRYTRKSSEAFKPHLHKRFSVGAMESGEVTYQVGDMQHRLKAGMVALVNPDTLHSCNPDSHSERSFYMLHLAPEWCLHLQQSLWHNETYLPVDCTVVKDRTMYELFISTMNVLFGDTTLLEKEEYLLQLGESIFARCCPPTVPISPSTGFLDELKKWLGSNLEEDLTLDDFSSSRSINPYTLHRQFRNAFNITPHAFRLNCRIEHARMLLQDGVDIGDVALQCGFFDQSHFHRHFKSITSVTPGEYRKSFHAR